MRLSETVRVAIIPAAPTRFSVRIRGSTAIGGAGLGIPLGERTELRPMVLAGYAQIRSDARTAGPFSGLLLSLADGTLADARIETPVYGVSLELTHRARLGAGLGAAVSARAGYLNGPVRVATDEAYDRTLHAGVLASQVEIGGRLPRIEALPRLRWLVFGGGTYVPGDTGDVLGVPIAAEIGLGLGQDRPPHEAGGGTLALRASAILGDRLVGWTLGLSLSF